MYLADSQMHISGTFWQMHLTLSQMDLALLDQMYLASKQMDLALF